MSKFQQTRKARYFSNIILYTQFYIRQCTWSLLLAIGALAAINQQRLWTHSSWQSRGCSSICIVCICVPFGAGSSMLSVWMNLLCTQTLVKMPETQSKAFNFVICWKLIFGLWTNFSVNSFSCFYDAFEFYVDHTRQLHHMNAYSNCFPFKFHAHFA